MRCAAAAGRRECQRAGPRPGERDHVRNRPRRHCRIDRHDQRQLGQKDDRREILHRVVAEVRIKVRADAVGRDGVEQQRVAVRVGLGDARGRDGAAGAGAIVDDDRLAERVGELRADDPRDEVGRPAGRHRDHELHGAARIGALGARGSAVGQDKGRDHE